MQDDERLDEFGERSPSGKWVSDAAFAIAVLTDPEWDFHQIDAGKAITHMQLAAWNLNIGSGMFTTDAPAVSEFLDVPDKYELTAVVVFGHPTREVKGIKDRASLEEIAFSETFGSELELQT